MRRVQLTIAAVCIFVGLWLVLVQPRIDPVTAGGRPRALWRGALPGLNVGIDSSPAAPGHAGYVELWAYSHDADDYIPLLRLPGTPAVATR
jgi:hypothetical protein